MTRQFWYDLVPSLIVALGVVAATYVASLSAESGWLVMMGPLALALAVVSADLLAARLRGASLVPSPAALILSGTSVVASAIVAFRDPSDVATLIPIVGAGSWVTLLMLPDNRRKACRSI